MKTLNHSLHGVNTVIFYCLLVALCLLNNGGCEHRCVESFYSHYCACNDGYMLNSDQVTCTGISIFSCTKIQQFILEINECSSNNGGCSQVCINTMGSYYCSCISGFTLSSNGRTCIGELT